MLNENKNENKPVRVLSRMGARQLTEEEAGQIGGGTLLSSMNTANGGDKWLDQ